MNTILQTVLEFLLGSGDALQCAFPWIAAAVAGSALYNAISGQKDASSARELTERQLAMAEDAYKRAVGEFEGNAPFREAYRNMLGNMAQGPLDPTNPFSRTMSYAPPPEGFLNLGDIAKQRMEDLFPKNSSPMADPNRTKDKIDAINDKVLDSVRKPTPEKQLTPEQVNIIKRMFGGMFGVGPPESPTTPTE